MAPGTRWRRGWRPPGHGPERSLERTLAALRQAGVYVTFEEFRGSTPLVRGGRVLHVQTADFGNPLLAGSHEMESGGSTGTARSSSTGPGR